jgi:PAS domain S-box-containing protein
MSPATILVIEDNPITRKLIQVALHSEGYAVLEAADGQTGLELMARHGPDLVLQDMLLPDMDGFDLVKRIRARPEGAAVPVLAVSGLLSEVEQARSLRVGFTDYLFKPLEASHLLRTVQAYLRPAGAISGKPGRGRRVLVADDDPGQRKLLQVQLELAGFQVVTASDGADALDQARNSPPDAIVSDVLMPQLDGFHLCLAVRQDPRLAGVPVVLISAVYTEEADPQLARSVGASALILRTPGYREVIEALLACFGQAPASPPAPLAGLPLEEYTHRVVRQIEQQVSLSTLLTRRLALLEAELGILARVGETLKNSAATEAVLGELLYHCLDAAGISRGAAYLLNPDGQLSLRARLGYGDSAEGPLQDYFGHADLLRRVLEKGEPVEINLTNPPSDVARDLLTKAGARSILIAPLVLGERRLGVVEMASGNRELGEDWRSFAKGIGSQIAQALELARTLSHLSASEQRYRDLVENLDAVVWEADPERRRFTFVSRRAEGLLGYPVARWLEGADFWARLLHPDGREQTLARCLEAVAAGRDHTLEYRAVAADGRVLWLQDTVSVCSDEGGRVCRLRGVLVDLTTYVRAKEHEAKMRFAREVQQHFFPSAPPRLSGFDIAGASCPAEATGGDYFDYIPLPDGSLAVAVGDVSGHGFGPALLMAATRAYLRALALTRTDLGEILALLNRALAGENLVDHFVTLLLARLDPRSGTLTYASAGHPTGYVLDPAGSVKAALRSGAPPLGIDLQGDFPADRAVALRAGDLVLLLTDGILEARSPDGAFFNSQRVLDLVRAHRSDPAREIVCKLHRAAQTFSEGPRQLDDITAVVIKVEAAA